MRILATVFVLVLAVLAGGYFVLQAATPPPSATAPFIPEVRRLSLHLHAYAVGDGTVRHWTPSTIVVNAGDTVVLTVTNNDPKSPHGLSLGALNIAVPAIPSGKTVTVRFKATRPGIFQFNCHLADCAPDHAEQTGQLVVLAP